MEETNIWFVWIFPIMGIIMSTAQYYLNTQTERDSWKKGNDKYMISESFYTASHTENCITVFVHIPHREFITHTYQTSSAKIENKQRDL